MPRTMFMACADMETVTFSPGSQETLLYLPAVPVAHRLVGPHHPVPLGEVGRERGLAPGARGGYLRIDDDVAPVYRHLPLLEEGGEREYRGDRHAARRRSEAGAPDLVPVELGHGVDELLEQLRRRVLVAVPRLVVGRVLQAKVGAQVDHLHPRLDELGHELHRLAVREGGEDQVGHRRRSSRGRCRRTACPSRPRRFGWTRKRYSPTYPPGASRRRGPPCRAPGAA